MGGVPEARIALAQVDAFTQVQPHRIGFPTHCESGTRPGKLPVFVVAAPLSPAWPFWHSGPYGAKIRATMRRNC
jgi:hypothetical protein